MSKFRHFDVETADESADGETRTLRISGVIQTKARCQTQSHVLLVEQFDQTSCEWMPITDSLNAHEILRCERKLIEHYDFENDKDQHR